MLHGRHPLQTIVGNERFDREELIRATAGHKDLWGSLARNPHLPADLAARLYVKCPAHIGERLANNPGITEDLALTIAKKDRRIGVLYDLASRPRSRAVQEAILVNPRLEERIGYAMIETADNDLRVATGRKLGGVHALAAAAFMDHDDAVATVGSFAYDRSVDWYAMRALRKLFYRRGDVLDAALAHPASAMQTAALSSPHLTAEQIRTYRNSGRGSARQLYWAVVNPVSPVDVLNEAFEGMGPSNARAMLAARNATGWHLTPGVTWDTIDADDLHQLVRFYSGEVRPAAGYFSSGSSLQTALEDIVRNPHLTLEDAVAISEVHWGVGHNLRERFPEMAGDIPERPRWTSFPDSEPIDPDQVPVARIVWTFDETFVDIVNERVRDAEHWDLVLSLASGFEGTLAELISCAGKV